MANFVLPYEPDDARHIDEEKTAPRNQRVVAATALRGECGFPFDRPGDT